MSTVNLAEVLIHTAKYAHAAGVDPVTFLTAAGLRMHPPAEAIARRVARLETSWRTGSPPPPRKSSAPAFTLPTALRLLPGTVGRALSPVPRSDGCALRTRPARGDRRGSPRAAGCPTTSLEGCRTRAGVQRLVALVESRTACAICVGSMGTAHSGVIRHRRRITAWPGARPTWNDRSRH
jgi:hypothetical protein